MDNQTPTTDLTRLKLLHALIYFSGNVMEPGKTKLFKLLNYLDFLHYEKTGRSVTGLDYFAWDKGPVPKKLFNEYENPALDFRKMLTIMTRRNTVLLQPRAPFNADYFSDLELSLMEKIAKRHFNDSAGAMSEESHFETGPWHEIYMVRKNRLGRIPYELTLERRGNVGDREKLEYAELSKAVRQNFE